jgi:hypothetical protein
MKTIRKEVKDNIIEDKSVFKELINEYGQGLFKNIISLSKGKRQSLKLCFS